MRIFDCDVHPTLKGREHVFPYIEDSWQHYFTRQEFKISGRSPERYPHPGVPLRADAAPAEGELPATDPAFVRKDLLEAWGVQDCLLLSVQGAAVNACFEYECRPRGYVTPDGVGPLDPKPIYGGAHIAALGISPRPGQMRRRSW